MRVPLTKYGWPEVVIYPAIILGGMILVSSLPCLTPRLSIWAVISIEVVLVALLVWVLSFFRDPYRVCPKETSLLLSPADGRVTDVEIVEENDFICGRAVKIGIFLSIFNVHINRSPCNAKVARIRHKKGRYKNAARAESGQVNESNSLYIIRTNSPEDKLIVRQISGAIARRIVCAAKEGQELSGGEKFGMIKFGSRTELYVPARGNIKCLVEPGDKVKAGLTPLIRYEGAPS
ncbi:MAG: phosphatidylserine decarboxylase [Phycisphaerae bacterium]|nr:phosphatidylserine decarboxylase [Phycisphaerae bacterium]MDD5380479.1 phosphatidylserine decarboxylase [Phycisphaerae bacterium]